MYKEEIKELNKQNLEYKFSVFIDTISIYFRLLFFKNNNELRKQLLLFFQNYLVEYRNERKILDCVVDLFKNEEKIDEIEEILAILDDKFLEIYQYNESVFMGYEEALSSEKMYKASYLNKNFIDFQFTEDCMKRLLVKQEDARK